MELYYCKGLGRIGIVSFRFMCERERLKEREREVIWRGAEQEETLIILIDITSVSIIFNIFYTTRVHTIISFG